eukprot:TRINITY_DN24405_c0_g1_i1.p1 TRINITY_DN24405_c0_g1~~TRINITY_DN24405_c0_g1_i1.p1  ORF type:complete len:270 (+),score=61.47 TRINITY_DN24405_c0_g1_i1:195-1004(+)
MRDRLKKTKLIVEVRDARVPLSSVNPLFEDIIAGRPRVLVLNKCDLVSQNMIKLATARLQTSHTSTSVVCISAKNSTNLHRLMSSCISSASLAPQQFKHSAAEMRVIGLPNVGKSSLINAIIGKQAQQGRRAVVTARPGTTRRAANFGVRAKDVGLVLVDTPGVLAPKIEDSLVGLKLAIVGCVRDGAVEHELLADYLLFLLNKIGTTRYVSDLKLQCPTDDVSEVVQHMMQTYGVATEVDAAKMFLKRFRLGRFGHVILDDLHQSISS